MTVSKLNHFVDWLSSANKAGVKVETKTSK